MEAFYEKVRERVTYIKREEEIPKTLEYFLEYAVQQIEAASILGDTSVALYCSFYSSEEVYKVSFALKPFSCMMYDRFLKISWTDAL